MSRRLKDSALRLVGKAANEVDKDRFEKAFENLAKAEKIAEKIKDPEISYHILVLKGFAKYKMGELEETLEFFRKGLKISSELFSGEPENEDYQRFIENSIGGIAEGLSDLEDSEEAEEYIDGIKGILDKAVRKYEELLNTQPENPEFLEKFLEIIDHLELCFGIGELTEDLIPLLEKKIGLVERLLSSESKTDTSELLCGLDDSVMTIGQAGSDDGHFEEIIRCYEQAMKLYEKILEKDPGNSDALQYLSYTWSYLGNLQIILDDEDKVLEYYKKSVDILENALKDDPENYPLSMVLANMYRILGNVYSEIGETPEFEEKSRANYGRAREIFLELLDKYPEFWDIDEHFAMFFDELAGEFSELGDLEASEACYKDEIQVYEKLRENEGELEGSTYELLVSNIYRKLGDLFESECEKEPAKTYYEKEIEVYERLYATSEDKLGLDAYRADTWNRIGDLYLTSEPETALQYHEKALEVFEKAFSGDPGNEYFSEGLLETLSDLAEAFKIREEYAKATRANERGLEVQKQLLELLPPEEGRDVGTEVTYFDLATMYFELDDREKAVEYHRLALERFEQIIAENSEDIEFVFITASKVHLLGFTLLEKMVHLGEDSGLSKEYCTLARKTFEELFESYPTNLAFPEMLVSFAEQSGEMYKEADKMETAALEFEYARKYLEVLYESCPQNYSYGIRLFGTLNNLGIAYSDSGEQEKGKEYFEKAIAFNEQLSESEPESLEFLKRAFVLFTNYAKALTEIGDSKSAEEYRKRTKEIEAKLVKEDVEWVSML